ncbi:glycoside hydrolase family protein [Seonamhaeicola marinus]|uniref:Family 43 glycosylhydrolase n=1 Tax=Seonamhaeicola marinus TaxID=1912246 RepID=A0A5D0HK37_9FLAO|nr:glycoside hydrolase family protein [Seonamhaeicola marinus]TYA71754.1 hypothetical protein FUA24_19565 [Seonamhaeicola marinus]
MKKLRSYFSCVVFYCFSVAILAQNNDLNLGEKVQPVNEQSKFIDPNYHIWGASVVKGYDGKYHMYYSRWKYELGHMAWVTDSEIAYAISETPDGPYRHKNVALPARGNRYWDGTTTHNPTIIKKEGLYYLYYMGTTSSVKAKQPTSMQQKDWWKYRNNQRIGVAWSVSPEGPWSRLDKPIIDTSEDLKASDALITSNPAINIGPDGNIFAIYKAVGKQEGWQPVDMKTDDSYKVSKGDRVRYMQAFAEHPLGPFKKREGTIFELKSHENSHMIAEDPYVWSQNGLYYALVTDIKGLFTGDNGAIALMESTNGLDWKKSKHALVVPSKILKEDGSTTDYKIERPQLLIEDGKPTYIFGALGITVNGVHRGHACNLRIALVDKKK